MVAAEERKLPYLFKQRHLAGLAREQEWVFAGADGEGWRASGSCRGGRRSGGWWQRRALADGTPVGVGSGSKPVLTGMTMIPKDRPLYEYAVLVTSLPEGEILTIAQLCRDRGDAGNVFDELKKQWAWTGFTTADLKRSQLMARIVALVFNWWSLYVRLAIPKRHT